MADEPLRCRRCLNPLQGEGYLMAGQRYCCQSCSVGSACEHQRVHRASNVRRLDSNFRSFDTVVRRSGPYESTRPGR